MFSFLCHRFVIVILKLIHFLHFSVLIHVSKIYTIYIKNVTGMNISHYFFILVLSVGLKSNGL